MKINELSKETGINLESIRYYEKIGLLPEPKRTANGYRWYDDETVALLNFIKRCRSLGFTLDEIKQLNQLKSEPVQHEIADHLLARQIENIEQKITQLIEIKAFLQGLQSTQDHSHEECKVIMGLQHL